jgi:hypothetical protein
MSSGTEDANALAHDAARTATDYLEQHGQGLAKIVVAIQTVDGGGAIVGMRHMGDELNGELLADLLELATIFAAAHGKLLKIEEKP